MATLPKYAMAPNVRGYVSTRVFDGVRLLDASASRAHKGRLIKALGKRSSGT